LNIRRVDLSAVTGLSFAIGVLLQSKAPFDVYLSSFGEIFIGQLGLTSPHRHAKPCSVIFRFTRAILSSFTRCHRKFAQRLALWRVAQFSISAQVTDDDNLVE